MDETHEGHNGKSQETCNRRCVDSQYSPVNVVELLFGKTLFWNIQDFPQNIQYEDMLSIRK